jgi:nuclear pore complex protein Nup205
MVLLKDQQSTPGEFFGRSGIRKSREAATRNRTARQHGAAKFLPVNSSASRQKLIISPELLNEPHARSIPHLTALSGVSAIMTETSSLESLQALHADLLALSESRLLNIERLGNQLDAHIQDFRALLDQKPRSEQSRQKLATGNAEGHTSRNIRSLLNRECTGKLDFDETYSVNQEFQQTALQVADDLNLDELDAARLCLESQTDSETSGRSLHLCSILRFHQRRKYFLDSLRLILQLAEDINQDAELQEGLKGVVADIVQAQDASSDSTKYVRRCLTSMTDIKTWLQKLIDKLNSASVIGKGQQEEFEEATEYQRVSLVGQHESLGVIVPYLIKWNYSSMAEFELVLETLKTADKFDHLLREYIPFRSLRNSREAALSTLARSPDVEVLKG